MLDGDQDPKTGFSADLRPLHRKSSNDKRSYLKHDLKVRFIESVIYSMTSQVIEIYIQNTPIIGFLQLINTILVGRFVFSSEHSFEV